jgi:hypothetical protein
VNPCLNCGNDVGDENPPNPQHCRNCPPTRCEDCGGICDWQSGALCSCWTSTEDLSLADLKALFADDCEGPGLSIERADGQPGGTE